MPCLRSGICQRILSKLVQFRRDERGSVAIYLGLSSTVLVGSMGLAAETGVWYWQQRQLQHAADVSAFSAGTRKNAGDDNAKIKLTALNIATASGFKPGTLTVQSPPATGEYAGSATAIEVTLDKPVQRLFSAIFSKTPIPLKGRAVVDVTAGGSACVLALSETASPGIRAQGSTTVNVTGCDLHTNSKAAEAFYMPDNSAKVTAGCVHAVGGVKVANPDKLTLTKCPTADAGAKKVDDPYANVDQPNSVGACKDGKNITGTITPTEYHSQTGMKSIRFCGGLTLKGTVNLSPGLYIIDGGDVNVDFTSTGNTSVTGTGVTFLLTNAAMKLNSNLVLNVAAPTTGPMAGILFFGDRRDSDISHVLNGGAGSNLQGAIYTPASAMTVSGNSTTSNGCTQVIANTIDFTGNSAFALNCGSAGTTDIGVGKTVKLVE